ncbi:MAG TPA: ATP-binding protein [Holophagaceae bacterium]|nr:ATP-binding protein [Holophagaceae bacterium]
MLQRTIARLSPSASAPPFLPLAFRIAASLGLMLLHLWLPQDAVPTRGEWLYFSLLVFFFLEALVETEFHRQRRGRFFATPGITGIRWNLLLDVGLVTLVVAYHGADQERLAAFYLFPVLASAFYVGTQDILGVGLFSASLHALLVVGFSNGWFPPFGGSGLGLEGARRFQVIAMASLQIFIATLVMMFLRRNLESLRQNLNLREAEADELAELHLRVVESMSSGLVTLDSYFRITSANPAAEAILQRKLEPGRLITDYLPLGQEALQAPMGEPRFELVVPSPEGARIMGGHIAPLRGPDGAKGGSILIFQDLTEWKALEERTRTAERLAAVGQLSAGLAHELRNPLASIMGCVQLLRGGKDLPSQDRVLGILARESDRVNEIVTHFLDFASPRDPQMQPIALPTFLEGVAASWEMDPRTQGLPLQMPPDPPALLIPVDPTSAHRIFMNLLSNARKAVAGVPEPRVALGWALEGRRLSLWVEDNGCGMDEDRRRRLFLPFQSGFEEGAGLGMSLVFQMVQGMGWSLNVDSGPGRGTRVTLGIPEAVSLDH